MSWVKFHQELREGAKRGLPRAVRFIYMELSLLARPGRGTLLLPIGMTDVEAVQDVLGGNRKEVSEALKLLGAGPEPMVCIEGEPGARRVVLQSWARWNTGTEAPGASTKRSQAYRGRAKPAGNADESAPTAHEEDEPQRHATTVAPLLQRPGNDAETAEQRRGNEPRSEKIREDQISHTLASARAEGQDEDQSPTPCTEAELADLLRAFPVLAPLADSPSDLTDLRDGFAMTHGDGATADLARGALAALVSQEDLRDATQAQRRARAAKFLNGARRPRAAVGSGPQSPDVCTVLEVFATAWTARKHREFVQADGDERNAAKIVELAREHAERLKVRPRVIVKHWAEQHLKSTERFVVDSDHALRTLGSQLTSYGLPRSGAAAPALSVAPAAPPSAPLVGPPPGFGDGLAKVGTGSGDAPLRRPGTGKAS